MTEIVTAALAAVLGWGASVEFRLGQLMKMSRDIEKTADRVDKIYELLGGTDERATEKGSGERRG